MLKNSDPALIPAADTRVSTHALTEALASIDARRTREAFARVGTVTLAEGLQDTGVEATPAEVYAEIETLREADAVQEGVKQRQRRLAMILKAEIVSAALCLAALFGLRQTLYNPDGQQRQQAVTPTPRPQSDSNSFTPQPPQPKEFRLLLGLTTGPHRQYIIHAVHQFSNYPGMNFPVSNYPGSSGETNLSSETAAGGQLYPLYWLPDGAVIHEDSKDSDEQALLQMGPSKTWIEFIDMDATRHRVDTITVYHNGAAYLRGWIMKRDVPHVLGGHSFTLYPFTVTDPATANPNMVSLTVAKTSITEAHGIPGWLGDGKYILQFKEGSYVALDEHAWERDQNVTEGS